MPDLSRFTMFARRIGAVPCVPQRPLQRGTSGEQNKNYLDQGLSVTVPHVPRVPHENDNGWDENDWQMAFEERAAILEYDGGHSRQESERLAREEIKNMRASS